MGGREGGEGGGLARRPVHRVHLQTGEEERGLKHGDTGRKKKGEEKGVDK